MSDTLNIFFNSFPLKYCSSQIDIFSGFFEKFPISRPKKKAGFDYDFFNAVEPKIAIDKHNFSINPPQINIFEGMNLGHNEVRHCSVLAWFMNPRGNHCQGSLFVQVFFKYYKLDNLLDLIADGSFSVTTEDIYSDNGRVDINIFGKNFWIIVEAKINADEQDSQIARYNEIINSNHTIYNIKKENCMIVFLTLSGYKPKSGDATLCISWSDINRILVDFARECKSDYVANIANQYAEFIKNNL